MLAVVLYHAGLGFVPGGFVGVDVFFVLSGFLITGLLVREVGAGGRVHFAQFYARRVRRLLPAAALVLLVTAVVCVRALPPLRVHSALLDIRAAALYAANYRFAAAGTDYLNADAPPSPVQHYWSLGVEEQFYLIWPALLMLAVLLARRRGRSPLAGVTVALAAVAGVSFVASLWLTHADEPWAFFSLPTRAWELAVGGLVALAVHWWRRMPTAAAATISLAGLAGVLGSVLFIDAGSPFPGVVALAPVLSTAAVLIGGCAWTAISSRRLLGAGPLQEAGRISYSWYLWHWPVLILVPDLVGHSLSRAWLVVLAASSGLLAYATTRLLEEPVRFSPVLTGRAARSLTVGVALSVTVLLGTAAVHVPSTAPRGVAQQAPRLNVSVTTPDRAAAKPLTQAQKLDAAVSAVVARSVQIHWVPRNLSPALSAAHSDESQPFHDGCHASFTATALGNCVYENPTASTSVFLIGDSHAAMWFPALDAAAKANDWRLTSLTKTTCPPLELSIYSPVLHRSYTECDQWRAEVLARIRTERPSLVVLGVARHYGPEYGFKVYGPQWMAGLTQEIKEIEAAGSRVLVLGPMPLALTDAADCMSQNLTDAVMCTRPLTAAVDVQGAVAEAKVARAAGASYVDVAPWLCTPARCGVIVGNLLVYRDDNHVTTEFASWLAPVMAADVSEALHGTIAPA